MSDSIKRAASFADKEIRIHMLARYWYCAAESKLRVVDRVRLPAPTYAIQGGLRVDEWLKTRPKSPFEIQFLERLGPEPYMRKLDDYTIIAHVDDFAIDYIDRRRIVVIEENKTVQSLKWNPDTKKREYDKYSLATAKFQLQGYAWVLRPLVEGVGYDLAKRHWIRVYRRRDARPLKSYPIEVDDAGWEKAVRSIIRVWKGEEPLIAPSPYKCMNCNAVFKARCPLWKSFDSAEKARRTRRK